MIAIWNLVVACLAWTVAADSISLPGIANKTFDFSVTWKDNAPDGFTRQMLLVNGQSPGPVIEVDQDDWVTVNVWNFSPFNTSMHFHGIEMRGTPWSDGVPGVTQRPIQPGHGFTYTFQATQYGAYWYHAHFRDEIEDGMYGAVIIRPRPDEPRPFHRISDDEAAVRAMEEAERHGHPLLIADLMHLTSSQKHAATVKAGIELSCYDSLLFNGHGRIQCLPKDEVNAHLTDIQKGYLDMVPGSKMTDKACIPAKNMDASFGATGHPELVRPGVFEGCNATRGSVEVINIPAPEPTWIAIHIIGGINFITGVISIDEHDMWVYAMDGAYIEPQKVQAITLTNGDRYSVLVKTHKPGAFKIRLNANSAPQMITGHALLSVHQLIPDNGTDSKPYIDLVGSPLSDDVVVFDQDTARPFPADPIAQHADAFYLLNMNIDGASYLWALNASSFMPSSIDTSNALPTLFDPKPYARDNHTITTRNDTWVDLVFLMDAFPMPPHPIHKHGNKMYQIGTGTGPFRWSSVNEAIKEKPELFNLVDPPRRDVFSSPPTATEVAWTAVRYHVTNPGPWLLHCHINNHLDGGMMVIIQDGIDAWPKVPDEYLVT